MNRYYTPHIDEFHDGFVYERFIESGWEERKATFLPEVSGDIRVRILSVDDVLSKGFNLIAESVNKVYIFRKVTDSITNPKVLELQMTFSGEFPLITITIEEQVIVSSILIQNINEFEFLLSRLII